MYVYIYDNFPNLEILKHGHRSGIESNSSKHIFESKNNTIQYILQCVLSTLQAILIDNDDDHHAHN
jgi:hypothetical protein